MTMTIERDVLWELLHLAEETCSGTLSVAKLSRRTNHRECAVRRVLHSLRDRGVAKADHSGWRLDPAGPSWRSLVEEITR